MTCPGCDGTGNHLAVQDCDLCGGNGLVNLDRLRTGMALAEVVRLDSSLGTSSLRVRKSVVIYDAVLKEHAARREHRRRERERQERKQPPKVNPSCGSVEPHDHSQCSASDSMNAMTALKVGDRILIDSHSDHPWAGNTGTVIGIETLNAHPHLGPRPVVRLDKGTECFIMHDSQARVLP